MKSAQMSMTWLIWILRVFFLIVVIFAISTVITRYANAFIDISSIHANILTYQLLLDKTIAVIDPVTQRLTPLSINTILPQQIDNRFVYPEEVVAAKLTIQDKEVFYRKQTYQKHSTLKKTIFGKQFFHTTTTYPATFNNQQTTMTVDVYTTT